MGNCHDGRWIWAPAGQFLSDARGLRPQALLGYEPGHGLRSEFAG